MWCSFFQRQFRFLPCRLLVMRRGTLVTALVTIVLSVQLVRPPAALATKFWKNSVVTGNWSTSNNWSASSAAGVDNGGAPIQSEAVDIVSTDGTARTVTYDVNAPALGYGFLSIDLTGAGTGTNTLSIQSNNTLAASAIVVGGYNGSAVTNGRGAIIQSAGTVKTNLGSDLAVGDGAGSTGTYTLSGTGTFEASQSEFIGLSGNGTFTQNAGTNTIDAGATGGFDVGAFAGSSGTYNLNGGALTSNKSEYVGDSGTGTFNQTAGTNSIIGSNNLYLGFSNGGGVGTYAISGTGSLVTGGDIVVGNAAIGVGTLSIQDQASVSIANNLTINSHGTVNLNGGTLRFNNYSVAAGGAFNYLAGTIELGGNQESIDSNLFPGDVIPSGKGLILDTVSTGATLFGFNERLTVDGGSLTAPNNFFDTTLGSLSVINGGNVTFKGLYLDGDNPILGDGMVSVIGSGSRLTDLATTIIGTNVGSGQLTISDGGFVQSGNASTAAAGGVEVTDVGSEWKILGNLIVSGGFLDIENGGVVYVGNQLSFNKQFGNEIAIRLNGGTLRFDSIDEENTDASKLQFLSGTIQLAGDRSIGLDDSIAAIFGSTPTLTAGKGIRIEGTATINSNFTLDGGTLTVGNLIDQNNFTFIAGKLIITQAGANLSFPIITGSSSVIDVNANNVSLGNASLLYGYNNQGALFVGSHAVTLNSAGYAKLGILTSLVGGTINAPNGVALGSGANLQGSGLVNARVVGELGSVIDATGALNLGDSASPAGFSDAGDIRTNQFTITLKSSALVGLGHLTTLGSGASAGTLNADNGYVVDFDESITGFGTINSANTLAKHATINGTVQGASPRSR